MFLSMVLTSTAHLVNSNGTVRTMYPEPTGSVQEQVDSTTSTAQPPPQLDAVQVSRMQPQAHTHGAVSHLAQANTAPKPTPGPTPTR